MIYVARSDCPFIVWYKIRANLHNANCSISESLGASKHRSSLVMQIEHLISSIKIA